MNVHKCLLQQPDIASQLVNAHFSPTNTPKWNVTIAAPIQLIIFSDI